MNHDVFISYSRNNLDVVKQIKSEIESQTNINCWMDLDGIESGEQFEDVIISAIDRSDTLLFMMSRASMTSEWALDEIDFAKRKGKRIVLIAIEKVEMTDKFYFRYHKFDNIDWNNPPQREKLIRDLRKWFNKNHSVSQHEEQTLNTSIVNAQTVAAEVHIEVDVDCDLYIFKKKIATLKANEDNIIHLKSGKYKLDFVSCKYADITKSMTYQLGLGIFSDVIGVSLIESVSQRDQAENAKLRAEEEAKCKVEEVKLKNDKENKSNNKSEIKSENANPTIQEIRIETGELEDYELERFKGENGKWGYKHHISNQVVIPCQWSSVDDFSEGLAAVLNGRYYGFIDKTGQIVIPCQWENVGFFSDGYAAVMNSNGFWGYIDKTGCIAIPYQWEGVHEFSEGLAPVFKNGWGYIDQLGKLILPYKNWKEAEAFKDGIAKVKDSDWKTGCIGRTGDAFFSDWLVGNHPIFSEGLAKVKNDLVYGKWGYIDKSCNLVIPCKWDKAEDFLLGKAKVYGSKGLFSSKKWYIIDKTGSIVD